MSAVESKKVPMRSKYRSDLPVPYLDRSVSLKFKGDWGRANFHRALGWLSYEMTVLGGPQTSIGIYNGTGFLDNIQAVGNGQVDVAITTPAAIVKMVMEGLGPFEGEKFPHLRALGVLPQNDRLLFAVRKELGVRSFDDLRKSKTPLRIATGFGKTSDFIGLAARLLMKTSGISLEEFEQWGGRFIESDAPWNCVLDLEEGRADAIINEAIMTPWWRDLASKVELDYLPIEPKARDAMLGDYGWPTKSLPAGYHRGITQDSEFLDFSDFLVLTTTDLPEDIAYGLAWSLVETFEVLEVQYSHVPPELSSVTYPLDPREACRASIPLHPGAERYYRAAGHL